MEEKTPCKAKEHTEELPSKRQKIVCASPTSPAPESSRHSLVPLLIDALTEQCPVDNTVVSLDSQRPRINSDATDMDTPRSSGDMLTSSSVLAQWEQQQSDALALHYRELHNAWAAKMLANAYQKQQQQQQQIVPAVMPLSSDITLMAARWNVQSPMVGFGPWQPMMMQSVGSQTPLFSQQQPDAIMASCDTKQAPEAPTLMPNSSLRSVAGVAPFFSTGSRFDHRTYFRG